MPRPADNDSDTPDGVDATGPPIGLPRLHLRSIASTNAHARELAAQGAPHGTVVTAAFQTSGRGRQGRTWSAPAGQALLFSVIVREPPRLLPLIGAVAIAEALGEAVAIKWPNDLHLDGRKVCGILAEGRPAEGWAVLGAGINVAVDLAALPDELRESAGTLGLPVTAVEPTLERVTQALTRWLLASDAEIVAAWRARDTLQGRQITWADGSGTAEGVDAEGSLLVRTADDTVVALHAGEVHLGRVAPAPAGP